MSNIMPVMYKDISKDTENQKIDTLKQLELYALKNFDSIVQASAPVYNECIMKPVVYSVGELFSLK